MKSISKNDLIKGVAMLRKRHPGIESTDVEFSDDGDFLARVTVTIDGRKLVAIQESIYCDPDDADEFRRTWVKSLLSPIEAKLNERANA